MSICSFTKELRGQSCIPNTATFTIRFKSGERAFSSWKTSHAVPPRNPNSWPHLRRRDHGSNPGILRCRTETENRFLDTFSSLLALPLVASKEANNGCSIDGRIRICTDGSCVKGGELASAPSARSWNVEIRAEDALL